MKPSADIVDMSFTSKAMSAYPSDRIHEYFELEKIRIEALLRARSAKIEQVRIQHEQEGNPAFSKVLQSLNHPSEQAEVLSVEQFLSKSLRSSETPDVPSSPDVRSGWSPKLRRLIEERHPEATRAERIRQVKERPLPTLENPVPLEVVKYYAENADYQYDV